RCTLATGDRGGCPRGHEAPYVVEPRIRPEPSARCREGKEQHTRASSSHCRPAFSAPAAPALTRVIPHLGHCPGLRWRTSWCIGHVYSTLARPFPPPRFGESPCIA